MIRFVSTVSLLVVLVLVLFLPSAYPPSRFLDQLRIEHQRNASFMGEGHASSILERMLDFHEKETAIAPASQMADAQPSHPVANPVADAMSQANGRFFNNPYFRSINALFILATYRCSVLIEWLPVLAAFMIAAVFDGCLVRILKSKEFLQHNPQVYAAYACATILTFCATAITFVLPVTLHPISIPIVPIAASIFVSRAVANFHRRA